MQMFRRKNKKGFTMIELMVVVVIVGVLAAIAIPIYGKYIKNARVTEATGRMGEIITACKAWAMENPNASGVPMWPTAAGGIVDLSATDNFTYGITATNPAGPPAPLGTLTVTATGTNKMAGVSVVITVVGTTATGSTPAVSGL
jgi:prepilin-type N-terminal cleavage/methylation domain-containing protein